MPDEESKLVLPRRMIQPTDEQLTKEVAEAVRVLGDCWDGEVDVTVIMRRRTSANLQWASNAQDLRSQVEAVLGRLATARGLLKGSKPV